MDFSSQIQHFEQLCERVQGGGDRPAQLEIVQFRQKGSPEACIAVGRAVLDKTSSSPYAQYEALAVVESAILRKPQQGLAAIRYLLDNCYAKFGQQPRPITRKYLFVAAAIYKRCFQPSQADTATSVDMGPDEMREATWIYIDRWMQDGKKETVLLALELLKNVFSNFIISCSRNMGLAVDYHFRCHCAFEELYLKKVYFTVKSVIERMVMQDQFGGMDFQILRTALEILVDLLQWNWNATVSLSTYIWAAVRSLNERTSVSASQEWSGVFRNQFLFDMFLGLFRKFRKQDPEIGRLALRGLEQMASFLVHDKITANIPASQPPSTFLEYLFHAVTNLLQLVSDPQSSMQEVFMTSMVLSRMASNQHVKLLMFLPQWYNFLQMFGRFSELCGERTSQVMSNKASMEDIEEIERSHQMVSFSNCLHAWSIFAKYAVYRLGTDSVARNDHPDPRGPAMAALKESLGLVYRLFLHTRLQIAQLEMKSGAHSKPQKIVVAAKEDKDDDGLTDEESSDQLLDCSKIGRAHLATSIPLVGSKLTFNINKLSGYMSNSGSYNQNEWSLVVEELHWLILCAGYLIADSSEWELTSSIPRIVSYHETATAKQNSNGSGEVVQLIRTVFQLLDFEKKCFMNNQKHLLSPLLSATLLWFCDRVIRTFFFRRKRRGDGVEAPYPRRDNTSESFITCFNNAQLFNQFIELVFSNLQNWSGNEEVLSPTCKLFRSCCNISRLSQQLMNLPAYQKMLTGFAGWTLDQVQAPVHRRIVASICMARVSENQQLCEQYYTKALGSISEMMWKIAEPGFDFQSITSITYCASVLEKLNGVIDGTVQGNCVLIRNFFFGCLPGFQKLLEVYKKDSTLYVPLVRLCTRFVSAQSDSCPVWGQTELDQMFDMSLSVMRFCRQHALLEHGGRNWSRQEEKEQYQLVRRLILLLLSLLQLVFASGSQNTNKESQVDVLYFGLAALLTHISEQLLDYPKLKFSYFRLLKRLLSSFPERFGLLPPQQFSRLMTTLLYALKSNDEKVQLCSIKGLKELFLAHVKGGVLAQQSAMSSQLVSSIMLETVNLLIAQNSPPPLLPGSSFLLLSLVNADRSAWTFAVQQLASRCATSDSAGHIMRAATALMQNVTFGSLDKESEERFKESIKAFVLETRGVEWKE